MKLRSYTLDNRVSASLMCRVSDLHSINKSLPMILFNDDPTSLFLAIANLDVDLTQPSDAIEFLVFKYSPVLYAKLYTYCYAKALHNIESVNTTKYEPYLEFVADNPEHLRSVIEACIDESNYKLAFNILVSLLPVEEYDMELMKRVVLVVYNEIVHYGVYDLLCMLKECVSGLNIHLDELDSDLVYTNAEPTPTEYYLNSDNVIVHGEAPYKLVYVLDNKWLKGEREVSWDDYQKYSDYSLDFNVTPFKDYTKEDLEKGRFELAYMALPGFLVSRYRDEIYEYEQDRRLPGYLWYVYLYVAGRYKLFDDTIARHIIKKLRGEPAKQLILKQAYNIQ